MRTIISLALVLAACLSTVLYAEETGYISDFKAVDTALINHPAKYTGNPDVDFRKQLILRRENIINMSEVALSRAHDPATVDLANQTISHQKRDIAEIQKWLDTH